MKCQTALSLGFALLSIFLLSNCKNKATSEGQETEANFEAHTLPREQLRDSLVNFAKQYQGVPYLYASSDPKVGFDCSGFINFVYRHFGYDVPRSSRDFAQVGVTKTIEHAQKGDLLLFTETDPNSTTIGHIGIVTVADGRNSQFIHSSSGKAYGVTITPLNTAHYQKRFVKVVDIIE